jgi:hypothetical protein
MGWLIWGLYIAALLVCLITDRENRVKLVPVSLVLAIIIFNPVFYLYIGERFLSGVYWRLFWTFPVVITIACVATQLISRFKHGAVRLIAAFVFAMCIAVSGQSVINRGTYTVAENEYQIPQRAIDVADIILGDADTRKARVIATDDLVCYIRQYTSLIELAYGRDMWGFIADPTEAETDIYDTLHDETVDYEKLWELANSNNFKYLVLDEELFDIPEDMEDIGYRLVDKTGKYMIYHVEEI